MATLFDNLRDTIINTFPVAAIFNPQAGGGPINIVGAFAPTPLLEEQIPGSNSGVANIWLLVAFDEISPTIRRGDTFTINSVNYDVADVKTDRWGGATLKLRRNA